MVMLPLPALKCLSCWTDTLPAAFLPCAFPVNLVFLVVFGLLSGYVGPLDTEVCGI